MKITHNCFYSEDFKLSVLIDYYVNGESKSFIIRKYKLNTATLYRWFSQYPFEKILLSLSSQEQELIMAKQSKKNPSGTSREQELQSRIKDLEKALALANLRAHALDKMIDIAEENEGIKIRKKPGTKQ